MPLDAPFKLGPFTIDESGRLFPTTEGRFPAFRLSWHGRTVDASMQKMAPDQGILTLSIHAGRVISTAEDALAITQARRDRVFGILGELSPIIPDGWKISLAADHGVWLIASILVDIPVSATALLTEVTIALLNAAPYLDLLADTDVALGSVKICPG